MTGDFWMMGSNVSEKMERLLVVISEPFSSLHLWKCVEDFDFSERTEEHRFAMEKAKNVTCQEQ